MGQALWLRIGPMQKSKQRCGSLPGMQRPRADSWSISPAWNFLMQTPAGTPLARIPPLLPDPLPNALERRSSNRKGLISSSILKLNESR